MRSRLRLASLFCLLAASAVEALPPGRPPTLAELLDSMRGRNPLLVSGRAHLDAVRAGEITAALRPNPVLVSANEDFRVFHPSTIDVANAQEFTEAIEQTLERGAKRARRVASARFDTTLAAHGLDDVRRQLA